MNKFAYILGGFTGFMLFTAIIGDDMQAAMKACEVKHSTETCLHSLSR